MPAVVNQESIGGHTSIGVGTLKDGTEVPVGVHRVKALGGRNFISITWTPFGSHQQEVERCRMNGDPAPLTWMQKVEIARKRDHARREKELAKTMGTETAATIVQQTAPLTGLAAQLAGFEDDEEMQLLIIKRWNEKRAADKKAAAKPLETEIEKIAEQTVVSIEPIESAPVASSKGLPPVGHPRK